MSEPVSPAERAKDKIRNILGAARADAIIAETMRSARLASLESPDERYVFGEALTKKGGLLEAIGRAIMVQALLQGAKAA